MSLLSALRRELRPLHQLARLRPEPAASTFRLVTHAGEAAEAAAALCPPGKGGVVLAGQHIRSLLALPHTGLYLRVDRTNTPFSVCFTPAREGHFALHLESGDREYHPTAGSPVGAYPQPRRVEPSALYNTPAPASVVIAVGVRGGKQPEYEVNVPAELTHLTLVVNGRVFVEAFSVGALTRPVRFRAA